MVTELSLGSPAAKQLSGFDPPSFCELYYLDITRKESSELQETQQLNNRASLAKAVESGASLRLMIDTGPLG
jgi:hypothetical protein